MGGDIILELIVFRKEILQGSMTSLRCSISFNSDLILIFDFFWYSKFLLIVILCLFIPSTDGSAFVVSIVDMTIVFWESYWIIVISLLSVAPIDYYVLIILFIMMLIYLY
jgi:hypothetical protein